MIILVDLMSLFYGALIFLGGIVLLKVIDIILEQALNRTFFSRIWAWTAKAVKKFMTRLKPIRIRFQFAVRLEQTEPSRVKKTINQFIDSLSEKHQEYIRLTPISWNADNVGSTRVTYNAREFGMDIQIRTEFRDFDPEEQSLDYELNKGSEVSNGIVFALEVDFPFHLLEQMLLNLGSLVGVIKEDLTETVSIREFSKGMFVLEPIKGDFALNGWIKKKQFDVSILLKAQERILVNLYPKKAEIIFPTIRIDDRVSEYLRETILNYYL